MLLVTLMFCFCFLDQTVDHFSYKWLGTELELALSVGLLRLLLLGHVVVAFLSLITHRCNLHTKISKVAHTGMHLGSDESCVGCSELSERFSSRLTREILHKIYPLF